MNFITEKVKAWQTTEIQLPSPLPPGEYDIVVRAVDEFGIESSPVKVRVKVKSPPKVRILAPTDGCVVPQTPTLIVRAEDPFDCEVKFIVKVVPVRGEPSKSETPGEEDISPVEENSETGDVPESPEPREEVVPACAVSISSPVETVEEGDPPRGSRTPFFREGGK